MPLKRGHEFQLFLVSNIDSLISTNPLPITLGESYALRGLLLADSRSAVGKTHEEFVTLFLPQPRCSFWWPWGLEGSPWHRPSPAPSPTCRCTSFSPKRLRSGRRNRPQLATGLRGQTVFRILLPTRWGRCSRRSIRARRPNKRSTPTSFIPNACCRDRRPPQGFLFSTPGWIWTQATIS